MDISVLNELIMIAEKISKQYQEIIELEVSGQNIENTTSANNLAFLLSYEKSLYQKIKVEDYSKYIAYIEEINPNIIGDIEGVIFLNNYFLPIERVYGTFTFLKSFNEFYNEGHIGEYNIDYAYKYIYEKEFFNTFNFFLYANLPDKLFLTYLKYNMIFSCKEEEEAYLNKLFGYKLYPMEKLISFINISNERYKNTKEMYLEVQIKNLVEEILDIDEDYLISDDSSAYVFILNLLLRTLYFLIDDKKDKFKMQAYYVSAYRNIINNMRPRKKSLVLSLKKQIELDEEAKESIRNL